MTNHRAGEKQVPPLLPGGVMDFEPDEAMTPRECRQLAGNRIDELMNLKRSGWPISDLAHGFMAGCLGPRIRGVARRTLDKIPDERPAWFHDDWDKVRWMIKQMFYYDRDIPDLDCGFYEGFVVVHPEVWPNLWAEIKHWARLRKKEERDG